MKSNSAESPADGSMKWGYAFAGACALGFAALIQVAFDGLDEETLANMPAAVAVPYGVAGKLGITVPLALLGVGLILRDVLVNRRAGAASQAASAQLNRMAPPRLPKPVPAQAGADDLEMGEPLAEEIPPPVPTAKPGKKIAALAGGFGGRAGNAPAATGGPLGDSEPAPAQGSTGQIVLSSAKYMNKNPGGSFRRGTTSHTRDE